QHAVGGLADGIEFSIGNVHRAVVERDQIPRHSVNVLQRPIDGSGRTLLRIPLRCAAKFDTWPRGH
ncbi:MAG: hypothetical protein RLZZ201_1537, partial [Actinomycetota bacterium]